MRFWVWGLFLWSASGLPFVFEVDDRRSLENYPETSWVHSAAKATALITKRSLLEQDGSLTYLMPVQSFAASQAFLEEDLCEEEPFQEDPVVKGPAGSGFLIGPDLLVSAGHVFPDEASCRESVVVFDFSETQMFDGWVLLDSDNVYSCRELLISRVNTGEGDLWQDFAVVKLDRPVVGRKFLTLNSKGLELKGAEFWLLGHPIGLPTKVTENGKPFGLNSKTFFRSTLDTYRGNSGGPVINPKTGLVEGILAEGEITDITMRGTFDVDDCWYSKRFCEKPGPFCDEILTLGAVAMRADKVLEALTPIL